MTTTNHQAAPAQRKATAVLGWFPTTPATEREILDMANARQIALRTRLRHHYWLTDCAPLTPATVERLRRKMTMIDPQDAMPDDQVDELLSPDLGFEAVAGGWRVPDLDEARSAALGSIQSTRDRMAALGKASAAKRLQVRADSAPNERLTAGSMAGPQLVARAPEVIDEDDF
jgi:hypothetical protein